jgi:hypothetical protein
MKFNVLVLGQYADKVLLKKNYTGLTLNELLSYLEDEDDDSQRKEFNVAIMPPVNSCQDLTDEEPDDEENATFENLPVSQLRAEDVWEDDDDIPLGLLQVATSKVTSLQIFFLRCGV